MSSSDHISSSVQAQLHQVQALLAEQRAFQLIMTKIKIRSSLPRTSVFRKQADDNKRAFD